MVASLPTNFSGVRLFPLIITRSFTENGYWTPLAPVRGRASLSIGDIGCSCTKKPNIHTSYKASISNFLHLTLITTGLRLTNNNSTWFHCAIWKHFLHARLEPNTRWEKWTIMTTLLVRFSLIWSACSPVSFLRLTP
jgi:hypothetical protein